MNKKILIGVIIAVLVVIGVIAFVVINNNGDKGLENKASDILNTNLKTDNNASKVLVVYFSKTGENYNVGIVEVGNTAMMAAYIKEYLNADSFEIVPVNKYADEYRASTEEAKKEQDANARPEIKNKIDNFFEYDTIFIGYPIWWGDLPMIVYTFLESYNFDGKTVIPFNTHEGSGNAGTYTKIKSKLTNAFVNTNGLALQGTVARTDGGREQTINWLKELGY